MLTEMRKHGEEDGNSGRVICFQQEKAQRVFFWICKV